MRILDQNGQELYAPDLSAGDLVPDRVLTAHHAAVAAAAEQGHYETAAEYANGGRDLRWVVERAGVPAQPARDEYEEVLRYLPCTAEQLAARRLPTAEQRLSALESAFLAMMEVSGNG